MEIWGMLFTSSKNWNSRNSKNKLAAYKMRINFSLLNYRKEKNKTKQNQANKTPHDFPDL